MQEKLFIDKTSASLRKLREATAYHRI